MEPLEQVQKQLQQQNLAAFIVFTEDAHHSEYISDNDKRRAFISGFTGSAGEAVITQSEALLWTDGRYFIQAENQLKKPWQLMKMFQKGVPTIGEWLTQTLSKGQRVGVDPKRVSYQTAKALVETLAKADIQLVAIDGPNLIDQVWGKAQPPPPSNPIFIHALTFAGQPWQEKVAGVRQQMCAQHVDVAVVTALDEVAWLYNFRGNDITYNPVALCYTIVTADQARLYISPHKVPAEVQLALQGVSLLPYEQVFDDLKDLAKQGKKVWVDPYKASYAIATCVEQSDLVHFAPSPVTLPKALKNDSEIQGLKQSHVRDAVALCTYFVWLEKQIKSGAQLSEFAVAEKLNSLRAQQKDFVSLSFETISSTGPNGAIIHYSPQKETAAILKPDQLYLVDSGGQYKDGTTDVTRTIHFSTPKQHERECFTRVLKGVISINSTVWPEGTTGKDLDILARVNLWQVGLDYQHGTGHGVGAFLNVHEGPQGISYRTPAYPVPLLPGMTMTDEPGYYESGNFGIRIENVLVVVPAKTPHNFANKEYYTFENITMVPIQLKLIDISLLTEAEINFIDDYHTTVNKTLSPHINDQEVQQWLDESTVPLRKYYSNQNNTK